MATKKKTARATRRKSGAADHPRSTGDSLTAYIRDISRFEPLALEQEQELGRRIQQGDEEAVKRLVEANLRFVVAYSKRYRGLGMNLLDVIHEGSLGLMEAARRYDPERNVKFISYAVWWVRQAIFHALSEQARIFRLPQKLTGQVARVQRARTALIAEKERLPTVEELSQHLSLPEAEVRLLLQAAGDDVSLSDTMGEDGGLEFGDALEQESVPSAELELIKSSFEKRMRAMLGDLDGKERDVLIMRFGLDGEDPRTLQEVGDQLGLTRERIRQIESRAKEKLRRSTEVQSLRGCLN
jgi:RNA polymerase primary sigma factor